MKVTAEERALFLMSPAEFNVYLAAVKEDVKEDGGKGGEEDC